MSLNEKQLTLIRHAAASPRAGPGPVRRVSTLAQRVHHALKLFSARSIGHAEANSPEITRSVRHRVSAAGYEQREA